MSLLRADAVSFSYGPQVVLNSITLVVGTGDRLAIVGPNGVGKTTLLRLLAEEEMPESGTVRAIAPVGLLPQERDRRPSESISAYLARRTGVAAAEQVLERAAQALTEGAPHADDDYSAALDRYLALGGPDLPARAAAQGADLGLPNEHDRPISSLSGGQVGRLALAAIILARFDVTLLDEPGNDLDLDALERLQSHLRSLRGGVVIVSHDRELLRRTATDVLEIDPHSRHGTIYGGGYDAYLVEQERALAQRHQEYDAYSAKRDKLVTHIRKQKEWARSGAQRANNAAARAKEPDKSIRHHRVEGAQQLGAKAATEARDLERLPAVEEPRKEWQLRLRFGANSRGSDTVATVSAATVQKGEFHLGPIDLQLTRGDRLAILGANGSGKTTLIDVLIGRTEPDTGMSTLGTGVVVGEMNQSRRTFDQGLPLLDEFVAHTQLTESDARTLLAKFGLGAQDVLRVIGSLSPGERTRAELALLMHSGANLLVLDEPTNHLDLPAMTQLEQALNSYDGTLVLVTHDRQFLENVHDLRTVQLEDGRMVGSPRA